MRKDGLQFLKNRILLSILLPVLGAGLLLSIICASYLTPPLVAFIQNRTDAELKLASNIGLTVCENHLNYLMDLRLEDDREMIVALKNEAIKEIKEISKQLHKINMFIIEDNLTVLGSSLDIKNETLVPPKFSKGKSEITTQKFRNTLVRMHYQYFPFWNWHVVSCISEEDYMAPIFLAKKIVYLGTFGVLILVLFTLFIVFNIFVNLPLKRIIQATEGVAEGKFSKVDIGRKDEIGQLVLSFNSMIENLNKKNDEVNKLIAALKKSDERQKTIMDSVQTGIITIDAETKKIVEVNTAATQMIGDLKEHIIGHVCHKHICPAEKGKCPIADLGQKVDNSEHILLKADGEKIPILKTVVPIILGGKEYFLESFVDLSEKKKLEAELQRAQKMEAIGTLAGGVAHDLNNILSGIVSYPELILMDLPEDSPLRESILTIQSSGERAAIIVQDLLTLARRGVSVEEVVNLNDIVANQLTSAEFQKLTTFHSNVMVETHFEKDLLNIKGSTTHLSKTVMNLLSNAAEAMSNGGKIFISTENQYIDRPIKGCDHVEEGDYVTLKIVDIGTGISKEDMEKIFEPFYTKKVMGKSGTGLGMAVVWGTVKDHKGYINVESTTGKGTTFTLYFPVTREEVVSDKSDISIEDYLGKGESILVVDDIKEQRKLASTLLNKLHYSVVTVSSGEEALDYMMKNAADLLVLDMIMDPGIDGLETYKRIIKLHPDQRAIIASGFSETHRVKEAQKLGAGKYIKKPYTLGKMGLAVKEELEK
ncbi:MAG: ATP-binding protein [Thermodesulfobacteriota bacterium]|nr:ATP-binding protein [Thermodesulfobacteriota bacterium]